MSAFPHVYQNYVEDVPGSTDTTWHEVVDANGNRKNFCPGTNTSGGHTYIYDQDNRLVSYSDLNDVVTTYAYDAFGRRISKTTGGNTTRYVYAGWDVIQERNGSNGLLRSYLLSGQATDGVVAMTTHNPSTGAATASYFYLKDARGNVVALATPAGGVVERYVYDAYGTPTVYNTAWGSPTSQSPLGNPYLFQSRNYDSESGLYYYRLRYMDPFVGRFITPDPIGNWGDAANLGNPYTFVGNNPWTMSDPFGLDAFDPTEPWWHHEYPREIFIDKYPIPWLDPHAARNGRWMPFAAHQSLHANGLNSAWEQWLTDYIGKNSRYPSYDELEAQRMLFREDNRFKDAYEFGKDTAHSYKNKGCKEGVAEKVAVREEFAKEENLIRKAVTRGELRVGEGTLEKLSVRKAAKTGMAPFWGLLPHRSSLPLICITTDGRTHFTIPFHSSTKRN